MIEPMTVDREWINLRFPDPHFIEGVATFVKFVHDRFPHSETTQCPCNLCKNLRLPVPYEEVKIDLYKNGFNPSYRIWNRHGESTIHEHTDHMPNSEYYHDDFILDDFDEALINSMVQDQSGNLDGIVQDEANSVPQAKSRFEDIPQETDNVPDHLKPLYQDSKYALLNFTRKLYNLKVNHGMSNRCFTDILQLFQDVLPLDNKTPKNTHYAVKVIKEAKLCYQKIHACPNDCVLFWKEHASKSKCPTCGASRYKTEEMRNKKNPRVPVKVLRYFPITPRLQRIFSVPWVAKEMTWHSHGRLPPGKMRHPVDSSTWKSLDRRYKDFSAEPRNVRLGLATDGFNPFGTFSTSYSCWPVMCVPYNLPPNLCMKPQFTMLTLLIEGPRQPGKDIDVYLQPHVEELHMLWKPGVKTFDASNGTEFNMCVMLLWTIHDLPAYGNVSGCRTKGRFGCPACGPNTDSFWLRHGKKHVYMGFRRWLSKTAAERKDKSANTFNKKEELQKQPSRLNGVQVKMLTDRLRVQWGKSKKGKGNIEGDDQNDAKACFCKQSIFFTLDYWKHIHVCHNFDVMHIEKNVCEILIALMLNTDKKTKDNASARRDLKWLKMKKLLWLREDKVKPSPARYWFTKEERRLFLLALCNLRVPFGFSSNWRNIVTNDGLDLKSMKSHDYHILMQHLLPMLIQHAFKDRKEIPPILRSFSSFFSALCSKVVDVDSLLVLEKNMAKTLCELEKIFPPSVFVLMMHLPIHLAYETRVGGPVYYRWMYPFERFMKIFKGYVANKARPEGCIAERYIDEEAMMYCTTYKCCKRNVLEKLEETMDNSVSISAKSLGDIDETENDGESGPVGVGNSFVIHGTEYKQARNWVLKCHPNYELWERKHDEFLQRRKAEMGRKSRYYKVPSEDELIPWMKRQPEIIADTDFLDIVRGPMSIVTRYKKYCINGYLFVTKDYEEHKRYQNSGVSTSCPTTFWSSAKDKSPVNEPAMYYGVLRDIIQLQYRERCNQLQYKPVVFKCDWVKVTHHGVKLDIEANLRLVNLSNLISSDQLGDEPFIMAEHANQVFYSKDPKEPDWHVVLESHSKVYYDDKTYLLRNELVVADVYVDSLNSDQFMEEELIFDDQDDVEEAVEKACTQKRPRMR